MERLLKHMAFSKKRFGLGMVLALCALITCVMNRTSFKVAIISMFMFVVFSLFQINLKNDKFRCCFYFIYLFISSFCGVYLSQLAVNASSFLMGKQNFIKGMLLVCSFILFIYVFSGRLVLSVGISLANILVLSTVNAYVFKFRGIEFSPSDILSIKTAMNVIGQYKLFPIPVTVIYAWIFAVILVYGGTILVASTKTFFCLKKRVCVLAFVCLVSGVVHKYSDEITIYHWRDDGAVYNGYLSNFVAAIKEVNVDQPRDYNLKLVDLMEKKYNISNAKVLEPTIIVIMDESFADLQILGNEIFTNEKVTPFIDNIKNNAIVGYAVSSVFGGRTANSEFEFLTSNTMAWLSECSIPYQQYLNTDSYSMVSVLDSMGYNCIAMHPFLSDGWNRPNVYSYFGFDEMLFLDAFPQEKLLREYVSDEEMFDKVIDLYENKGDDPLFLFGITMQNHGGYDYDGENYTPIIELEGYSKEYNDIEQYLTLIHETDKAVEKLITYFENVDDDVMVVFFGDHLPKVDTNFFEEVHCGSFDTLDEQMLQYMVPFFIWANYDIEEQYVECTSLNYLSNYMYEVAGIELPAYNQFLKELQEVVPAMNVNGYYSVEQGYFVGYEEEEIDLLNTYEILQYNNLFDIENRSEIFFPLN